MAAVLALARRAPGSFLVVGLLWAVLAVGVAALFAKGRSGIQTGMIWAVAGIVLVILVLRLFQTGG